MGRELGKAYFYLVPARRRRVEENLSHVLGRPVDDPVLKKTARRAFGNFGMVVVDFLCMGRLSDEDLLGMVEVEGRENLDKGMDRGKGVLAVSGHLGNWELGAAAIAVMGYPLNAITLSHGDPRIDRIFVKRRADRGVKVIPMGMAVKRSFRAVRDGEAVAVMGDRDIMAHGARVPFFGCETTVPRGPAVMAQRTGAAIVPTFAVWEEDRYRLCFEEPIIPCPDGDPEKNLKELTAKVIGVLERYISRYPDQWSMFYRMWPDR